MKRLIPSILAALLLPQLFAAAVPEGESRRLLERQTGLLSARLLYGEAEKRWLAEPMPEAAETLYSEMKRKPAECASRATALKRMEPRFAELLAESYRDMAEHVLAPFREKFSAEQAAAFGQKSAQLIAEKQKKEFPAAFEAARKRLVDEQRAELTDRIYPTETELEADDDAALTRKLLERFTARRKTPLWEELLPRLGTELVAPVLRSARAQQKRQLDLAARLEPDARLWDPAAAEAELEQKLNAEIAGWKEEKRYALFPRTRQLIRSRAGRLPQERAIRALQKPAAAADYAALLARDPAAHADPAESFRQYEALSGRAALAAAAEQLAMPEQYRKTLETDAEVKRALARRFETLKPELQKHRNEFAARQLQERFPAVAGGSYRPSPEAVEAFRADPAKLPELPGEAAPGLLAESRTLLKQKLTGLLAAGNAELSAQLAAVDAEYDAVVAEMEKMQSSASSSWLARWFGSKNGAVDLETIRVSYGRRVLAAFHAGTERRYPELFPKAAAEIELRSRAILQRLNTPPEASEPSIPPPETVKTRVWRIRIDAEAEVLTIRLKERAFSGSLKPSEAEATEKRLTAEVVRALEELCDEAVQTTSAPQKLTVRLEVGGGRIYYRFVAELREALKNALKQTGASVEDGLRTGKAD